MPNTPVKIAIVVHSLAHGGAERSSALLSQLLDDLGFEIHVITVTDAIEYAYAGQLFNLGALKKRDDSKWGRFKRLLALKKFIDAEQFDWVIDNRTRHSWWSEWIISKWLYPVRKTIYVVRSANIAEYFPVNRWIATRIYAQSPYIVAVSDGIKREVESQLGYRNVIRIYNAQSANLNPKSNANLPQEPYILSYGRIDDAVKNFSLLIEAYATSGLSEHKINLVILGDGKDKAMLEKKVARLGLTAFVNFVPRVPDPSAYIASALFTVLSSRYEGFPRVLIESLQLGVPVVSVDCVSGPAELVQNEKNGLLVPNNDVRLLADALWRLATDLDLYDICRRNARQSVAHLSPEIIAKQWQQILITR